MQAAQVPSEAIVENVDQVFDADKFDAVPSVIYGVAEIAGELAGGSASQVGPSDATDKQVKEKWRWSN